MASDYPGRTILVGYFVENQEAGTAAERQQFSDELFDKPSTRTSLPPARAASHPWTHLHGYVLRWR